MLINNFTKQLAVVLTIIILSIFVSLKASAQIVVIVHPSVDAAPSKSDISRIFLGKSDELSGGIKVEPLNQNTESASRQAFDRDVLGRNTNQIKAYWNKLLFTGNGTPPTEMASDEEIIQAVASNPKAIGYIDAASINDQVKVVFK